MLKRIGETIELFTRIGELALIAIWILIAYKVYMLFFGPSSVAL